MYQYLFSDPFLKKQIIAYIGNKRRLLPLISKALNSCNIDPLQYQFIDFFSGSGVVSRFAKANRFRSIISNDWEEYSYCLNFAYLSINPSDLEKMFQEKGGLKKVLEFLNSLDFSSIKSEYIAKHYAPQSFSTENLDFKKERLFYTRENALKIDVIRGQIDYWYQEKNEKDPYKLKEKYLLIAIILYLSATHTNTSGVFKAYHKGFGGHGRHALNRILKPISMFFPILCESDSFVEVFKKDALVLANEIEYSSKSVTYLDPPYNQHQYGSNYHLLNSIAYWDKINVSEEIVEGNLKVKAGIRTDWKKTKSSFCTKKLAMNSFKTLINSIKSQYILISYNTEGLINFSEMIRFLQKKGATRILTSEYLKYPGGKGSLRRLNNNIEYILILDQTQKGSSQNLQEINSIFIDNKLRLFLKKGCKQSLIKEVFTTNCETSLGLKINKNLVTIKLENNYLIKKIEIDPEMSHKTKLELIKILNKCICQSKTEELEEIVFHLSKLKKEDKLQEKFFLQQFLLSLKGIANKKNKKDFENWFAKGHPFFKNEGGTQHQKLQKLHEIYTLRVKL